MPPSPAPLALALLLLTATATAHAATQQEQFAHFFSVTVGEVKEVVGYTTPAGVDVTHILLGRYARSSEQRVPGVVLMRCDARRCQGTRVWLHPLDAEIEILGLVDMTVPGPLGRHESIERGRPGAWVALDHHERPQRRYGWPALLIALRERTPLKTSSRFGGEVSGTHRRSELMVLSLRAADERTPQLLSAPTEDIYPTGSGSHTSYQLAPGSNDKALDIVATEQREIENRSRCLRPKPIQYRLVLEGQRYARRTGDPWKTPGCH